MRWLVYILTFFGAVAFGLAGCNGSTATLQPGSLPTAAPPFPLKPLQFDVLTIGPSVASGWQCPTGILRSRSMLPSSLARHPLGVHVATGGCDENGFPIPSPLPSPPSPTALPLATANTQQIVPPAYILHVPAISGWTASLAFPACAAGTCDAGTTNGVIALHSLSSASSTTYAFALVFRYVGPEPAIVPSPSPGDHPAPHVYNLYGPPEPAGAPLQPVPVFVSGAPLTLGFPQLTVQVPSGAPLDAARLRLTVLQKLTPPTYEEAVYTSDFSDIPLVTSSPSYAPVTTTPATATFALPTRPFPFQTDFTEYDFTVTAG